MIEDRTTKHIILIHRITEIFSSFQSNQLFILFPVLIRISLWIATHLNCFDCLYFLNRFTKMAKRKRPKIKTGVPRKKAKIDQTEEEKEKFDYRTIKLSLNSILKDEYAERLIYTFDYRCFMATRISALASLLLLYKVNFAVEREDEDFFMNKIGKDEIRNCFLAVTMEHIDQLPDHFREMVENVQEETPLPWPSKFQMGNAFNYLHYQYETNVTTNLTTHCETRIRNYLKMLCYNFNLDELNVQNLQNRSNFDDIDVRNTIKNIMLNEDWTDNDPARIDKMDRLYAEVARNCTPSFTTKLTMIDYIESNWFESLWFFGQIQVELAEFLEENQDLVHAWLQHKKHPTLIAEPDQPMPPKVRNFTLVPMCNFQLKHIRFDHTDYVNLLIQLGCVPNRSKAYFTAHKDEAWKILFDMEKIEKIKRPGHAFNYMILTDGVSASVIYKTPKREIVASNHQKIQQKLVHKEYKYITSWDPGMKTYLAGVRRNIETGVEVSELEKQNLI